MNREQLYSEFIADIHKIKRAVGEKTYGQSGDISVAQGMMLHLIRCHKDPTISTITARLGTTTSATTQHVNALVKAGLITKTQDQSDARRQLLTLTKRGEDLCNRLKNKRMEAFTAVFSSLSDKEFSTLQSLIHKAASTIQSYE